MNGLKPPPQKTRSKLRTDMSLSLYSKSQAQALVVYHEKERHGLHYTDTKAIISGRERRLFLFCFFFQARGVGEEVIREFGVIIK